MIVVHLVRGLAVVLGRAGTSLYVRVDIDGEVPVLLDRNAAADRGCRRRLVSTPPCRLGEAVLAGGVGGGCLEHSADRVVERLELGAD